MGVTASGIANTIRIATIGDSDASLAKFSDGNRQIPIIVRLKREVRDDLFLIQNLRVPTATGKPVPLAVLADIQLADGPGAIERYDRMNRNKLEADLAPGQCSAPPFRPSKPLPRR